MQPTDVFPLLGEIAPKFYPLYRDVFQAKMAELEIDASGPDYYIMAVSHDFRPEPASVSRFAERAPYANSANARANFQRLVDRGWLVPVGEETFTFTDEGLRVYHALDDVFLNAVREIHPLPDADMKRIVALLGAVVEAAVVAPEPAVKIQLPINRHSDPGPGGPASFRIMQFSADLNCWRDDVHVATWKKQGVPGPTWEAFSLVWGDEAFTPAEIIEKRPGRGYDEAFYATALQDLVTRGWVIADTEGAYHVTKVGKSLRQAVEDETNRLYYAPWAVLTEADLKELSALLIMLRDSLAAMVEAREAAAQSA